MINLPVSGTAVSAVRKSPDYRAFSLHNIWNIPQLDKLSEQEKFAIRVVSTVLPFKVNSYVLENLIDWDNYSSDPIFRLTFPHKNMLLPAHFEQMADVINAGESRQVISRKANEIRAELNPHPAGQLELNVPMLNDQKLTGIQHKYRETVLFFPRQGQTCHAYCTFCFRWPQFVGINEWKFAMKEKKLLTGYLKEHPEVTDIIFTGGDPMVMKTDILAEYINALLDADLPNLQNIRIGTKALSYWPYKFVNDDEASQLLKLFERVIASGRHLTIMAHFSHAVELSTTIVQHAIGNIRATGAEIRTQSPILQHINDNPEDWKNMWQEQVKLGCIPYYMFVTRDTGAQHYFGTPLVQAWKTFRDAYKQVSGIARTVRGPSMSCSPGKVQVLGVNRIKGEKFITLSMLQGRDPDWVMRPFYAKYDPEAIWIDDLKPAFGEERFFFEDNPIHKL